MTNINVSETPIEDSHKKYVDELSRKLANVNAGIADLYRQQERQIDDLIGGK